MATSKETTKKKGAEKRRIRIKIKSFDAKIIESATQTIVDTVLRTDAEVSGPIPLPTHIKKYSVNKSTFVHKKAQSQYETRTHKRLLDILEPTTKTVDSLMNLSLPAGVDVEIKM
jgi:small subunit ribosomal protein S10